ncbi:hypothetical protein LPJ56_001460 [Coemansia sp. RSA 2599]|nr:hypothetical protein LPJ56_001460 [Coemansia sp. RSA 2599]
MPPNNQVPAEDRPLARFMPQTTFTTAPATNTESPSLLSSTDSANSISVQGHSQQPQSYNRSFGQHNAQSRQHAVSHLGIRGLRADTGAQGVAIAGRDDLGWQDRQAQLQHAGHGSRQPPAMSAPGAGNGPAHRQTSSDRSEGVKRSRNEYDLEAHAHIGPHSDVPISERPRSTPYSSGPQPHPGDQTHASASGGCIDDTAYQVSRMSTEEACMPVSAPADQRQATPANQQHSRSMSVSVSPAQSSGNSLNQRHGQDPAAQNPPQPSERRVYSQHQRTLSSEEEAAAKNDGGSDPATGGTPASASAAAGPGNAGDADNERADAASDQRSGSSKTANPSNDAGSDKEDSSHHSQKRRLNQACLLCRRKKIRCDSAHPSCSNCQRRGIQCIYPEVRKRGRPPRMYTFADFALPGQPLPPELQGLANVHASAMLPTTDSQGQSSRAAPQTAATAAAAAATTTNATSATAGNAGYGWRGGAAGAVSGTSTPAYAPSDYDQSPALPPISVAVGRGGGGAGSVPGQLGSGRGPVDPMLLPTPPLGVDQAVLDLFEYITPSFPIIHRQTLVQKIRERSLSLPLWLAIHAVSSRFEPHYGSKHAQPHYPPPTSPHSSSHRSSSAAMGAGYAEKAHAMLVNRFGYRQPRSSWARSERGRAGVFRDASQDVGGPDKDPTRREVIELLQSHILLSIFYAGNREFELAAEIHAAAVKIAQRMGINMMDDPVKLQDFSGIFNPSVAPNQRRRAQDWLSAQDAALGAGPGPGTRSQWHEAAPPPLPGGPNDTEMHEPASSHADDHARPIGASNSADLRRTWIEFETLRRLWWAMFILDRMYHITAGSPRMIHVGSFRVRLPCSDLEWDSMHAQPTTASPKTASADGDGAQPAGLMVRTFREAVMHTSLSEQAANEISATPSIDPDVYRYTAALAGLFDSVIDFGEDIRALAAPPLLEGTEILAQLRAEQLGSDGPASGGFGQAAGRQAYGRYHGPALRSETHGRAASAAGAAKQTATSIWLGSRRSSSSYIQSSRSGGWHSSSARSAWPPDWRTRMRVLQERAAALETQFTEWYSSTPIAQYARKPYLYSQLPLQDRITYFHQQIIYYGGVIQLQSLVVMAQGLLLPEAVDDASTGFAYSAGRTSEVDGCAIGPSALANMMWRSLMDMDPAGAVFGGASPADARARSQANDGSGDAIYAPRRRQYGMPSAWQPRRHYALAGGDEDDAALVPLDEDGNSPEIVREELQRMVEAAWRRCTEAAIAMSTAVKRATEVRRVASANPNTTYYDPTFRPQVLPPYRGDVGSNGRSGAVYGGDRGLYAGNMARHERTPLAGEMRASPQQPHSASMAAHHQVQNHNPNQNHQQQQASLAAPGQGAFGDSAAGPGQVVDDATFFMRFNMFTCSAAYVGAFIHLQNLRLSPRWRLAAQRHGDAVSQSSEMRALQGAGAAAMAAGLGDGRDLEMLGDPQDIGALPPQLPPPLPPPPCTAEQARESVKPLVKILEGISPYWRVSGHVAKLRSLWREIEGAELSYAPTGPSDQRPWAGPAHPHPHPHPQSPPYPLSHSHPHSLHHSQRRQAHQATAGLPPPALHMGIGMTAPAMMGSQQQPHHPYAHAHAHAHSGHSTTSPQQQQHQQQMGMPPPPQSRP